MRSLRFTGGVCSLDVDLVQGLVGRSVMSSSTPTWSRQNGFRRRPARKDDQPG